MPSLNTQPTHAGDQAGDETDARGDLGELFRAHLHEIGERLERALADSGFDGVVIFSGDPVTPARDDQPYPFRAEPFFVRWCPLTDVPGAALVLEPGRKPRLLYPASRDFWHAAGTEPADEWADAFDVRTVASTEARDRELARVAPDLPRIGGRPASGADRGEPVALLARLGFDRARKTDYEIECIRRANRIAAAGHQAVAQAYGPGSAEFDLNLAYLGATRQREEALPYPNIVALNEHASVLHYQHLDRAAPPETRLLLIDAGARFRGYASDVTRTSVPPGSPIADLAASMEAMQQSLAARALAGMDFVELNETAHELLAGVLREHALVTCSADEAHGRGITRIFLPHGLGHLLGLQVHDVGGRQRTPEGEEREPPVEHPFLRLTRRLEAGFVVTIEPGIYFIDSLLMGASAAERRCLRMSAIDRLRPWGGIRIEDDVAVRSGDNINLTRAAFARLGAVQPSSNFNS